MTNELDKVYKSLKQLFENHTSVVGEILGFAPVINCFSWSIQTFLNDIVCKLNRKVICVVHCTSLHEYMHSVVL